MVELIEQGLENPLDIREVDQPARLRVDLAFAHKLDVETVPVETAALVARRDVREAMGRLKRETPDQTNTAALTGLSRHRLPRF